MISDEYIAGFLDADGSVSLQKERSHLEEWNRKPVVEFYNTDMGILQQIQVKYGGDLRQPKKQKKHHTHPNVLRLTNRKAMHLLLRVEPHMLHSKKKMQASLIIEHYDDCTPKNGKYDQDTIDRKMILVERVMGIQMRSVSFGGMN